MTNPTRRSVLRAGAWAAPVVALTAAAPLAAASDAPAGSFDVFALAPTSAGAANLKFSVMNDTEGPLTAVVEFALPDGVVITGTSSAGTWQRQGGGSVFVSTAPVPAGRAYAGLCSIDFAGQPGATRSVPVYLTLGTTRTLFTAVVVSFGT
jgi:hypothetical protein